MKTLVLLIGMFITLASPFYSYAADILNIGGFDGLGAASDVAERKGFLEAEGITVVFHEVHNSVDLMTDFISGNTDVIQTNADNIIAWAEGQGLDQQPHDFVIIMGGYNGLEPRGFVVSPDITSFEDVRGKVLAVDAINTGYAPVLVYMLKENGLVWNKDYTLMSVGGGAQRVESMLKGETAGGLVSLNGELRQRGFHRLSQSTDYFIDYARGVTATRRDWADSNGDLLVRYIRALIRSIDWLLDPDNRQEAISIIMSADSMSPTEAQLFYEESVDPDFGFIPGAKIERSGIEQIIKIREVMGEMKPPLPSANKFIEERFYNEAIKSM
jgi:ABC-type nitrate/sulfonate/bicarbonate transport system substrate-binding protein